MAEENKEIGEINNLDSLKEKLLAVTNEIDAIKTSFTKSTEELSKIQSMLDVSSIEDISGVIQKFENRIAEEERKRVEAVEGARKYSEELEKEKERLIKLWDAYKNQEQELAEMEKKAKEYEEKWKAAEASKKQIEDDYTARINTLTQKLEENETKVRQFDEYEQRCQEFDHIRNNLEEEIHELKQNLNEKEIFHKF